MGDRDSGYRGYSGMTERRGRRNNYGGGYRNEYGGNNYRSGRGGYNQRRGYNDNYQGRGGYNENYQGRGGYVGGALSTERPRPMGGRGRGRFGKKPDNMMERPGHVAVPEEVQLITQLVVGIGNFTDSETYDALATSIKEVAELLLMKGDLATYATEISNLFVKCFSQLTMQTPAIATLLSLVSRGDRTFADLVVGKLLSELLTSMKDGDVIVARNLLRGLGCLASSGAVSMDGEGQGVGLLDILDSLCRVAEGEVFATATFSVGVEVTVFLLASLVPYIVHALQRSQAEGIASRIAAICRRVAPQADAEDASLRWRSCYDVGGSQEVFHVNIEGTTPPPPAVDSTTRNSNPCASPRDAVCWDSLWEVCKVADDILTSVHETNGASMDSTSVPKCLLLVWMAEELQEELRKDVAQVVPGTPQEGVEVHDAPASLPPRLILSITPSDLETILTSTSFALMAGPSGDGYLAASTAVGSKTERAKFSNNSATGYASWMSLRFNLFDEEMGQHATTALTTLSLLELVTARDYFRSVLRFFEPFIRDDGTCVGSITLLCSHLASVNQFFPSDAHLEYVLVETLLLMILQVPAVNPCLVQRVTLELCQQSPEIPPVLAAAIAASYELIPALNVASWREMANYLSVHLANTHLAWPYWQYWGEEYSTIVSSEEFSVVGNSQKTFLDLLVGQCTRLSLPDRMHKAVGEGLTAVVPADESVFAPRCTHFAISTDGICTGVGALESAANGVIRRLMNRESPEDLGAWLEGTHEGIDDDFQMQGWRLVVLMEGILCRGAVTGGTISGMIGLIDRYRDPLMDLSLAFDGAYQTLAGVLFSCLHHQCALLHITLDALMRRAILHPSAVVSFMTQVGETAPGGLHLDEIHKNQWVWKLVEVSMDRCLDIVKAAVNMQNNAAVSSQSAPAPSGDMEVDGDMTEGAESNGDCRRVRGDGSNEAVVVPEEISSAVAGAADGSRTMYSALVTHLLVRLHGCHSQLVVDGSETEISRSEGTITCLDPGLIARTSMLHRVLRIFHLTEKGLVSGLAQGTSLPPVTARGEVSQNVLEALQVQGRPDPGDGTALVDVLGGPAKRIWNYYSHLN
mmetsp:Transcript_24976/g.36851  ORF Transcript_24976/g.36851 Transcript_24976/m.36851 type:complete len:1091 (+) Transcript_24976:65-3337(+)|eukprot:CAMPEP_0185036554 /NCGR_PEP_ID=MMETSP1103-20130426/29697_1 /TAXON_ID=36769 /ORGANISM="Paraphysomonas bandaiensis, Strain Caron Lab Isolate" /LENGTH=1090 /DNA_ID=CAMNT_0027574129 /DNA_START=12 /DNA_END=3284 /DNA_ORIENTATION=-